MSISPSNKFQIWNVNEVSSECPYTSSLLVQYTNAEYLQGKEFE